MSKRIALKDFVEVDGHDLSNFFSQIGFSSEHAQEDVSGFSTTGNDEFLAGKTAQSVSGQVFGAYDAAESWDVMWPLHKNKTVFTLKWRPDSSLPVSATNPEVQGNAQLLSWAPGATRGSVDSFPVTFTAADATGFDYVTT
jgi:hypothetical protein